MTEDTGAQMERTIEQLEEIEKRLREGKVVKIEPMPRHVAPPPQAESVLRSEMTKEDRLNIAARIIELSNGDLEPEESDRHIALKVGDDPYSVAATVSLRKDRVSFHIPSSDLEKQAIAAGFSPKNGHSIRPFFKHKCHIYGLTLVDLQKHEPLFMAIIKDSVDHVLSWRPKGK